MKKVTIFTKNICEFGGIESFVCSLANMLKDDYEVKILSIYGTKKQKIHFNLSPNIAIDYLIDKIPKEVSMARLLKSGNLYKIAKEIKRRRNIAKDYNERSKQYFSRNIPDILISDRELTNALAGNYLPKTVMLVATEHNYHQNNKKYIKNLQKSLKKYSSLVVPTVELKNFYQKAFSNIHCEHIPNIIEQIPKDKTEFTNPRIVTIGRLRPEKDFITFVDVVALIKQQIPTVTATIVGEGPERPKITKRIKDQNLEDCIKLVGEKENDEIFKILKSSSLYLMTSITESFGIVLLEAMAAGVPPIAFDRASGARNIIKNNTTGYLVKNSDKQKMANIAINLLNNKSELIRIQKNVNKEIEKYSPSVVKKLWKKVLG